MLVEHAVQVRSGGGHGSLVDQHWDVQVFWQFGSLVSWHNHGLVVGQTDVAYGGHIVGRSVFHVNTLPYSHADIAQLVVVGGELCRRFISWGSLDSLWRGDAVGNACVHCCVVVI